MIENDGIELIAQTIYNNVDSILNTIGKALCDQELSGSSLYSLIALATILQVWFLKWQSLLVAIVNYTVWGNSQVSLWKRIQ